MKRKILFTLLCVASATTAKAQNPASYTAEKTDNTAASLNLKNPIGFWHLSGPRSNESNNKFSVFWNNGTYHRYMTILDNGNVGIGIAATSSKLHLFNGSSGRSPHGFSDLSVEDDDHGMISILTPSNKSAYYGFADTNDDFVGGIQYDHTVDRMQFRVNNRSAGDMVITNNGNVGIGTTNPTEVLDVNGNIIANRMIKIDGHGSVASLQIMDNSNTSTLDILLRGDGGNSYIKNGKVGIGTSTPDSKFTVKGNIHAEEVKVDLSVPGPDYVFKEGYDLKSLEEVQNYIEEHGHLPSIPSAKEMEANGIQLGEMNMKLLEKIEELTLYILQQEKRITTLEQQIKAK